MDIPTGEWQTVAAQLIEEPGCCLVQGSVSVVLPSHGNCAFRVTVNGDTIAEDTSLSRWPRGCHLTAKALHVFGQGDDVRADVYQDSGQVAMSELVHLAIERAKS